MLVTTSHERTSAIALESKSCASPTKYPADRCPRRPGRDQDRRRDSPPAGEAIEDADQADGDLRGPPDRPRVAHLLAIARTPMKAGERVEREHVRDTSAQPLLRERTTRSRGLARSRISSIPTATNAASRAPTGARERPRGAPARAPDPRPSKLSTSPAHPTLRKKVSASSLAALSRSGAALAVERTHRHSASGEPENPPLLLPHGVSDDRRVTGRLVSTGRDRAAPASRDDSFSSRAGVQRTIAMATKQRSATGRC